MNLKTYIISLLKEAALQEGRHSEHRKYSHDHIVAAQQALGIGVDGIVGEETLLATADFQRREGATLADGLLGPETFRLLEVAYAEGRIPLPKDLLASLTMEIAKANHKSDESNRIWLAILYNRKRNYSATFIRAIQSMVGADEDGVFGFETVQRVRLFQTAQGICDDGRVGPKTLKILGLAEQDSL